MGLTEKSDIAKEMISEVIETETIQSETLRETKK